MAAQPPNALDLNGLDFVISRATQSNQSQICAHNASDLITAVNTAFKHFARDNICRKIILLQTVMKSCIDHDGSNNFSFPHIEKSKMDFMELVRYKYECLQSSLKQANAFCTMPPGSSTSHFSRMHDSFSKPTPKYNAEHFYMENADRGKVDGFWIEFLHIFAVYFLPFEVHMHFYFLLRFYLACYLSHLLVFIFISSSTSYFNFISMVCSDNFFLSTIYWLFYGVTLYMCWYS